VDVESVNDPPVASFSYVCNGLTCDFDGEASHDPDGSIVSYDWDFGDGQTGSGVTASNTYNTQDTYDVVLTVWDDGGATGSAGQNVSVSQGEGVHIGDLDGYAVTVRNKWTAHVVITVHDSSHMPVEGARVHGEWANGSTGSAQCTTDSGGQCQVSSDSMLKKVATVDFMVLGLSHAMMWYDWEANHDSDGDSDGTRITVSIEGGNQPPVASFTAECTGLACDFDASGSTDADGSIVSYDWDFGDGQTGSGVAPSHTYDADGQYDVVLTVTDDGGATGTDTQQVTVSEGGGGTMHVGDLDGDSEAVRSKWTASVTVTVHDESCSPVSGATVTGSWSGGARGDGSCVTDGSGQCLISKGNLKMDVGSVTFTVNAITHASLSYDADRNHDLDGDDSDGTTIIVAGPQP
jgi:PKD repeat protein